MPSSPFSGTRIETSFSTFAFPHSSSARTRSRTAKLRTQTGLGRASSASFALCVFFSDAGAFAGALAGRARGLLPRDPTDPTSATPGGDADFASAAKACLPARAESRLAFAAVSRDATDATSFAPPGAVVRRDTPRVSG